MVRRVPVNKILRGAQDWRRWYVAVELNLNRHSILGMDRGMVLQPITCARNSRALEYSVSMVQVFFLLMKRNMYR